MANRPDEQAPGGQAPFSQNAVSLFLDEGVTPGTTPAEFLQEATDPGFLDYVKTPLGQLIRGVGGTVAEVPKAVGIMSAALNRRFGNAELIDLGRDVSDPKNFTSFKVGELIDKVTEAVAPDVAPGLEESWLGSKIPRGLGSVGGFAIGAGAGQVPIRAGLGGIRKQLLKEVAEQGVTTLAAREAVEAALTQGTKAAAFLSAGVQGAMVNGASSYERAINEGADQEQAWNMFVSNGLVGFSEAIPVGNFVNRLDKLTGGLASKSIVKVAKETAAETFEEAIQEGLQSFVEDLSAQAYYDPSINLTETWRQSLQAAKEGGAVGAVASLITQALAPRMRGPQGPRRGPGPITVTPEGGAKVPVVLPPDLEKSTKPVKGEPSVFVEPTPTVEDLPEVTIGAGQAEKLRQLTRAEVDEASKTGAVPAEPTPLAEVHAPVASAALRGARLEAAQEVVAQQETQEEKGGEIDEGKEKRNVQGRKGTQKPEDGQKPEGQAPRVSEVEPTEAPAAAEEAAPAAPVVEPTIPTPSTPVTPAIPAAPGTTAPAMPTAEDLAEFRELRAEVFSPEADLSNTDTLMKWQRYEDLKNKYAGHDLEKIGKEVPVVPETKAPAQAPAQVTPETPAPQAAETPAPAQVPEPSPEESPRTELPDQAPQVEEITPERAEKAADDTVAIYGIDQGLKFVEDDIAQYEKQGGMMAKIALPMLRAEAEVLRKRQALAQRPAPAPEPVAEQPTTTTERETEDAATTDIEIGTPAVRPPQMVEQPGQPGAGTTGQAPEVTEAGVPGPGGVPELPGGTPAPAGITGETGGGLEQRPEQPQPEPGIPAATGEGETPAAPAEPGGLEAADGVQVTDEGQSIEPTGRGAKPAEPALEPADRNNVIEEGDVLAPPGVIGKIRANIAAIKLLKKLESEGRNPTPAEKKVLQQYTGWGQLSQVFDETKADAAASRESGRYSYYGYDENWTKKFYQHYKALRELLTDDEMAAARASTLNAHYTSTPVIRALWKIAARIGFTSGSILEPAAGVGHILGLMPTGIGNRSQVAAIELDKLSGRILAKLYPQANVFVDGFESVKIPPGSVDLAITNVPFAETAPHDPEFKDDTFNLHNYFIAKILKALKPGGVGIIITSSNTMDSQAKQRSELAKRGELLAAIRLPNTAFKENAGTEVTTDILILRKPVGNEVKGEMWEKTAQTETHKGEEIWINEYFVNHPEMVLGKLSLEGTMYRKGERAVLPDGNLEEQLEAALERIPQVGYIAGNSQASFDFSKLGEAKGLKDGSLVVREGKLAVVDGQQFVGAHEVEPRLAKPGMQARARDYVTLRDDYRKLVDMQIDPEATDEDIAKQRAKVNKLYDTYVKRHGYYNEVGNSGLFSFDPDSYLLTGIETEEVYEDAKGRTKSRWVKAPILAKRINQPATPPARVETAGDALAVSMSFQGQVELAFMAELTGKTENEVAQELAANGLAYIDPDTGLWQDKNQYLSGNVREKLRKAELAAQTDRAFARNVEALKAVIPEDKPVERITFKAGTRWIPQRIIRKWVSTLGYGRRDLNDLRYVEALDKWFVPSGLWNTADTESFRTPRIDFKKVLEKVLNQKTIEIFDTFEDGSRKFNEAETIKARLAADRLNAAFQAWARADEESVQAIEEIFNNQFNAYVDPDYTVDRLDLPGLSTSVPPLRQNQKNGIYRLVQQGRGLLAHVVGAGKTMTMIAAAMEMRRLGIARKPMIVVHNPTLAQFAGTARAMYPGARILVATKEDLAAKKRKRFLAKVVSGDFDLIIMPQSSFNLLPNDPKREASFAQQQIDQLIEGLRETDPEAADDIAAGRKPGRGKSPTVKEIEKAVARLRKRLSELQDRYTEDAVYYEQLGIDQLFIDEAHHYKKPPFVTQIDRVAGLDKQTSQRAYSLLLKVRHTQDIRKGRGVVMATGTPITNTLGEAWHMLNFVNPDALKEMGVDTFDKFVGQFVGIEPVLDTNAAGNLVLKTRLARFTNGQELIRLIRGSWDVLTSEMLKPILEANGQTLPEWQGGKMQTVLSPLTDGVRELQAWVRQVLEAYSQLSGDMKQLYSFIPVQAFNVQKRATIDMRLIDPTAPDDPDSKLNQAVQNILRIYRQTSDNRGAQAVFLDTFNTYNLTRLREFAAGEGVDWTGVEVDSNDGEQDPDDSKAKQDGRMENEEEAPIGGDDLFLFRDIKRKLVEAGIPEEEIFIFNELKDTTSPKAGMIMEKVNAGEIRVVIGSRAKLGTGVNIQRRLAALHDLDMPWTPAEIEQGHGRAIRAGNTYNEVYGFIYGMQGSMDAALAAKMAGKSKFFWQIMSGAVNENEFDDPSSDVMLNAEEQMAFLSNNPLMIERVKLTQDVRMLNIEREADIDSRHRARREIQFLIRRNDELKNELAKNQAAVQIMGEAFPEGREIPNRKDTVEAWQKAIDTRVAEIIQGRRDGRFSADRGNWLELGSFGILNLGTVNGITVELQLAGQIVLKDLGDGQGTRPVTEVTGQGVMAIKDGKPIMRYNATTAEGVMRGLTAGAKTQAQTAERQKSDIDANARDLGIYEAKLAKPWPREQEWQERTARLQAVEAEFAQGGQSLTDQTPRANVMGEGAAERSVTPPTAEERTVTPEALAAYPAEREEGEIQYLTPDGALIYVPRTKPGLYAIRDRIKRILDRLDQREVGGLYERRLLQKLHEIEKKILDYEYKAAKEEVSKAWRMTQGIFLVGPPLTEEHFRLYKAVFNLALYWVRRQINPALRTVENFAAWAGMKLNRLVKAAFEDALAGTPRNKIEDLPKGAQEDLAGMDKPEMPADDVRNDDPPQGPPSIPSWVPGYVRRKLSTALGWIKDPEYIYRTETEAGRDESARRLIDAFGGDLELAMQWINQGGLLVGVPDSLRAVTAGVIAGKAQENWANATDPVERKQWERVQREAVELAKQILSAQGQGLQAAKQIERMMGQIYLEEYRKMIRFKQERALAGRWGEQGVHEVRWWLHKSALQAVAELQKTFDKAHVLMSRWLKKEVRGMDKTFREIFEDAVRVQGDIRQELFRRLLQVPDFRALDNDQQLQLANLMLEAWGKEHLKIFAAEFRKKIKDPMVEEADKTKALRRAPQLVRWANLGLLDNEAFRNAIAPEYGVREFDQRVADKLFKMAQAAQDLPEGAPRQTAYAELFRTLTREADISAWEIRRWLGDWWYASILSGLSTQGRNIWGNTSLLVDNFMTYTVRDPRKLFSGFSHIAKWMMAGAQDPIQGASPMAGIIRGLQKSLDGESMAILRGEMPGISGGTTKVEGAMRTLEAWNQSDKAWQRFLSVGRFVMRFMIMVDSLFYNANWEMAAAWEAEKLGKGLGFKEEELDKFVEARIMLTPEMRKAVLQQVAGEVRAGLVSEKNSHRRVNELLRRKQREEWPDWIEHLNNASLQATLNNEPKGFLGILAKKLIEFRRSYPVLVTPILPFIRIGANVGNQLITHSPAGLYYLALHAPGLDQYLDRIQPAGLRNSIRDAISAMRRGSAHAEAQFNLEIYQQLRARVLLSHVAMMGLGALAMGYLDDDDPPFQITGTFGSLSRAQRMQLKDQGIFPYQVRIGGVGIVYRETPFAAFLAMIGNYTDSMRYGTDLDKKNATALLASSSYAGYSAILDQSFLSGVMGFLDRPTFSSEAENWWRRMLFQGARAVTALIPRAAKDVATTAETIVHEPTLKEATTLQDYFLRDVPVARWALKDRLNVLGETIPEPQPLINWLARWRPGEGDAWEIMGKFAQSGVYIPLPGKTVKVLVSGERRIMTPDEFRVYAQEYGQLVKKKIEDNASVLRRMTPEKADDWFKSNLEPLKERARRKVQSAARRAQTE